MLTIKELKELYTKMTGHESKGDTIPEVLDEIEQAYVNPQAAIEELKSKIYDDFIINFKNEGGTYKKVFTFEEYAEKFDCSDSGNEAIYIIRTGNVANGQCLFFFGAGFYISNPGAFVTSPKLHKIYTTTNFDGFSLSIDESAKTVTFVNGSPYPIDVKRIM